MAGKRWWYHQGRASGGWHAPLLVRVWIVAPLAILGAIGVGWLIYYLVVDRLVASAPDAIKTTLAILTLFGAVLAGVYAYRKQRIAESDAHRADVSQFADELWRGSCDRAVPWAPSSKPRVVSGIMLDRPSLLTSTPVLDSCFSVPNLSPNCHDRAGGATCGRQLPCTGMCAGEGPARTHPSGGVMQYRYGVRRAAAAMVVVAAATALATGCQPSGADADAPSVSVHTPAAASTATGTPSSPASEQGSTGASADPAVSASSAGTDGDGVDGSGDAAATCDQKDLLAQGHRAKDYPPGTGTGAEVVGFKNTSGHACALQGFPTVGAAGMTRPDLSRPLAVTQTGSASPVRLAPGRTAWVKLTFGQVQGEADGGCDSGAEPQSYPTMIVGLPGVGKYQVQLEDGHDVVMCDDKVTVTAVTETKPS
ncbi:DUF4232 domain-containing protein [Streptomyces sp. NPDC014006]|uniref:DUF4232 domain-containing protein n=1 Tax=Streptomyces sp. NPDC014006 TaxID=3364870 RepID=UPI0036FA9AE8